METINYQCPACGGKLIFSAAAGTVVCEYCDSSFTVAEIEALYAEKEAKANDKADAENNKAARQGSGTAAGTAGGAGVADMTGAAGTAGEAGGADPFGGGDASDTSSAAYAGSGTSTPQGQTPVVDTVVETGKQQAAAAAAENLDPIAAYLKRSDWSDSESGHLRSFTCSSCAAELIVDMATAVTQCPYCGNNTVLPGTLGNTLKPDYVIPFEQTKEAAISALERYYKGKKFLPKSFMSQNHLEEIQGVYVPFWLYSAQTDAQATFSAENKRVWIDDDYEITETDHYLVGRAGKMNFYRVPVDGSQRMPDAHMDAIEPYDYSKMVDFSTAYLPGYVTDRYDLDIKTCQPRAYNRMAASSEIALEGTVIGYDSVMCNGCNVNANWTEVSYALLPVWMLHTKWQGKDFLFAMNGQTGRFVGDLPVDKGKLVKWFLGIAIPAAVAIGAVASVLFA